MASILDLAKRGPIGRRFSPKPIVRSPWVMARSTSLSRFVKYAILGGAQHFWYVRILSRMAS